MNFFFMKFYNNIYKYKPEIYFTIMLAISLFLMFILCYYYVYRGIFTIIELYEIYLNIFNEVNAKGLFTYRGACFTDVYPRIANCLYYKDVVLEIKNYLWEIQTYNLSPFRQLEFVYLLKGPMPVCLIDLCPKGPINGVLFVIKYSKIT